MPHIHQIKPGEKVKLADLSTRGKDFHPDRKVAEADFAKLREKIGSLQEKLYAENKHRLLVLFQAMDTGGKDGTVREVFGDVNPHGIQVTSFKVPSAEELARDFLWRVHRAVPASGQIGVFNRSHYEDVLIVRVENIVPPEVWKPRFKMINKFEEMLAGTGTTILKFFLHISEDEQKERLQQRLTERKKQWKFSVEDVNKRKDWASYMQAYEDVLEKCSTDHAPWHVIPADQKWYRNFVVAEIVHAALAKLDPQFPTLDPGEAAVQVV